MASNSFPLLLNDRVAHLRNQSSGDDPTIPVGAMGLWHECASGNGFGSGFESDPSAQVDAGAVAHVCPGSSLPVGDQLAIIFCAVVGSRAYGLDHDDSDTDRRGVYVPSSAIQFSLDGAPEQLVHDGDQLCFWEAEKFLSLALRANPTVLETLFSPVIEYASPWAQRLIEQRDGYLSKRAFATFMGYADSQFDKMQRSRERGTVFKWAHAMHLIRLLRVGIDLVQTGSLTVVVPHAQRDELLAIKRGELGWSEVIELRTELIEQFKAVQSNSPLPDEPDRDAANKLLIDLRLAVAGEAGS